MIIRSNDFDSVGGGRFSRGQPLQGRHGVGTFQDFDESGQILAAESLPGLRVEVPKALVRGAEVELREEEVLLVCDLPRLIRNVGA